MALDDVRFRARRELEQIGLSVESAAYLVDDRPPGGWESLATKDDLRVLAAELRAELHRELRAQTWRLMSVLAVSITLMTGVFSAISKL